MANEKRLIDAIKHVLDCHIAKAVNYGVDNIPTGKDSSSAFEFLRGYERGATETANIVLGMIPVDAVEVVHGRWIFGTSNHREWMKCSECLVSQTPTGVFSYCPNCGAKMDGDGNA